MSAGWQPYALDTRNEGREYRCTCGSVSKMPGLDGWWWRWKPPTDPERSKRGRAVEARCAQCSAPEAAAVGR